MNCFNRFFLSFLITLILIPVANYAETDKMKIAVMDLQPNNVDKPTAMTISDLLRTELYNTGYFTILERNEMKSILKEQGFAGSGLTDCNDVNCAVKIGKLLSASKILVGTVNKLGDVYIINVRIVDVGKGIVSFADKHVVEKIEKMTYSCEILAKRLADKINDNNELKEASLSRQEEEQEEPNNVKEEKPMKYVYPMKTLGLISLGVSVACFGTGLYFNNLANENNNDAQSLYSEYQSAYFDFNEKWQAYEEKIELANDQETVRNVLYISAGATAAFSIVTIFFIKKRVASDYETSILPGKINLTYRF